MPRKKHFTEKQNGLLSLTTRVDANLTKEERLLLGYIIKEHSTRSNFLKENGYVHASVRTIKQECGMGQDSIEQARIKLENEGLITCEIGRAKVHNTRYRLTEKTKKYIYVPESVPIDEKSVPISVPEEKKVHDEQNKRIESLELRISELTNAVGKLTEEVQNMKKYIGIGLVNPLFNSSSINKVNLKNSSSSNQNTIATGTGGLLSDDELFQDEPEEKGTDDEYIQQPAKPYVFNPEYFGKHREQATEATVVSSSLQFIEEENHPDTNDISTLPNADLVQTDRFNISQSITKTQPQPLDKGNAAEWLKSIRSELKHEVFEWSLTITCTPEYLTGDDYNPIVTKVMNNHPEWINYQGQFSLFELGQYTLQLMENRMNNKDIPAIIAKNSRKSYQDFGENCSLVNESDVRIQNKATGMRPERIKHKNGYRVRKENKNRPEGLKIDLAL